MRIGETVVLGNYAGESISWTVLAEEEGAFLLISRDILDCRPFHGVDGPVGEGSFESRDGAEAPNWSTCDLRVWLNGAFLTGAFSEEERAHLLRRTHISPTLYRALYSDYPGKVETEDTVFILSEGEVKDYMGDEALLRAEQTAHADKAYAAAENIYARYEQGAWWLRSYAGQSYSVRMQCVYNFLRGAIHDCTIGTVVDAQYVGVRPAVWYKP